MLGHSRLILRSDFAKAPRRWGIHVKKGASWLKINSKQKGTWHSCYSKHERSTNNALLSRESDRINLESNLSGSRICKMYFVLGWSGFVEGCWRCVCVCFCWLNLQITFLVFQFSFLLVVTYPVILLLKYDILDLQLSTAFTKLN